MNLRVVVRPEAERELLEAEQWYEGRRAGLGHQFRAALDETLARVASLPLSFPIVQGDKRRALVPRFGAGRNCDGGQMSRYSLVAGVLLGGFVAQQLGPVWWRLYWVAVSLFVLRFAWVIWTRLGLPRMAAGLVLGAGAFAAFSVLGNNQREVSAAIGDHWAWFTALSVATLLLFYWEGRRSPVELRLLERYSQSAGLRDRITFQHIRDLRGQKDA